jgi:hypothetical protein
MKTEGGVTPKIDAIPARATRLVALTLTIWAVLATAVQAQTSATITPSLSPDRPGAKAALTFTIRYASGELGVPSPVRRSVVRFPAGLSLDIPSLRSCAAARLLARGPSSCPARSLIGRGHALAEVRVGSQIVTENVTLWAFVGPLQTGGPTLEIYGRGYAPTQEQVVVTGTMLTGSAPYGDELVIPIPPIPTLPLEPSASMVDLSLTIGAGRPPRGRYTSAVIVPASCPAGGFPFAAEFTYADGSTGSALATARCPWNTASRSPGDRSKIDRPSPRPARAPHHLPPRPPPPARRTMPRRTPPPSTAPHTAPIYRAARAARTISLNESGSLHLTGKQGFTLYERGSASGTFTGTIYVRLTIASTSRVQAEVSISRSGGSISGDATASYRRAGASASFSGSLSIGRGSGSYSHARGSGLSFSGTIQSSNDAIAVHLSGRVSD